MTRTPAQIHEQSEVTQFDCANSITIWAEGGQLLASMPYNFYNSAGQRIYRVEVQPVATAQQATELQALLLAIKRATDGTFEALGWTQYTEPE